MSNNWYVITGGPCAGKTTALKNLEKLGVKIVHEVARGYIDEQIAKGKTIEQIRSNEAEFQKALLGLKVELENKLSRDEVIIFDRGIPDSIAYFEIAGLKSDHPDLKKALRDCTYKKVFLLDLIDFQQDYARTDGKVAKKLHRLLEKHYGGLGIEIVKVPIMKTKKARAKFIFDNL